MGGGWPCADLFTLSDDATVGTLLTQTGIRNDPCNIEIVPSCDILFVRTDSLDNGHLGLSYHLRLNPPVCKSP
jgi:hypothetical protein